MNEDYRELKELRSFVEHNRQNKALNVEIRKRTGMGYYVVFRLNNTLLYLCRQIREDRHYKDALRMFPKIDSAVNIVLKIGYKGNILINFEESKGTLF